MRFLRYLKENNISNALSIEEPKIGKKYAEKLINKRIDTIQSAIKQAEKKVDDKSTEAILADLEDKLDKWSNVDKETSAPKAVLPKEEQPEEQPPEEEQPEESPEEGPTPEEQETEKDKERDKDQEENQKEEDKEKKDRKKKNKEKREKLQKKESRIIRSKISLQ